MRKFSFKLHLFEITRKIIIIKVLELFRLFLLLKYTCNLIEISKETLLFY